MLGNLLTTFCLLYSLEGRQNNEHTFALLDFVSN